MAGHNNPPPLKEILSENYRHFTDEIEDVAGRATAAPKTVRNANDLDAIGVVVKDAKAMVRRVRAARTEEKEPFLKGGREVDAFFGHMSDRLDHIVVVLEERASEYQRQKAAEERRKRDEEARKLREKEEAARRKAEEAAAAGRERTADKAELKADTLAEKAERAEREAEAKAADLTRTRGASGTLASAKTTTKIRIVDLGAAQRAMGPLGPYVSSEAIQKAGNAWLKFNAGQPAPEGLEVYEDVKATFR